MSGQRRYLGSGSTITIEETTLGAQEVQCVWRRRHLELRKYNECGGDDTWGSGSTMSVGGDDTWGSGSTMNVEETTLGAQEVQ